MTASPGGAAEPRHRRGPSRTHLQGSGCQRVRKATCGGVRFYTGDALRLTADTASHLSCLSCRRGIDRSRRSHGHRAAGVGGRRRGHRGHPADRDVGAALSVDVVKAGYDQGRRVDLRRDGAERGLRSRSLVPAARPRALYGSYQQGPRASSSSAGSSSASGCGASPPSCSSTTTRRRTVRIGRFSARRWCIRWRRRPSCGCSA